MPRVRIHFRKTGDLRWISHRDLVRTMERMFRRGGWELKMSEGFHPKPKLNFPSALAVGIEGGDEWMEVDLDQLDPAADLAGPLRSLAPAGLEILSALPLADGTAKPQLERSTYEIPIPEDRQAAIRQAIAELLQRSELPVPRAGRARPVDVRGGIEQLELVDGKLRMVLAASRQASVRPRDVLEILQLTDLEQAGYFVTRTSVELTT